MRWRSLASHISISWWEGKGPFALLHSPFPRPDRLTRLLQAARGARSLARCRVTNARVRIDGSRERAHSSSIGCGQKTPASARQGAERRGGDETLATLACARAAGASMRQSRELRRGERPPRTKTRKKRDCWLATPRIKTCRETPLCRV